MGDGKGKFAGFLGGTGAGNQEKDGDKPAELPRGARSDRPALPAGSSGTLATTGDAPGNVLAKPGSFRERRAAYAEQGLATPVRKMGKGRFAVLLDATGSMQDLIDTARRCIISIITRVREEGGELVSIELFVYRDYCDGALLLERSGPSSDPATLEKWLTPIRADGGGDTPEAIEHGLNVILQEGGFSAVILAGDAPGHDRADLNRNGMPQTKTAREIALDFAAAKIPIHTFVVGGSQATVEEFEVIAKNSGGQCGRLDGSDAMRDMAVIALLAETKGTSAVSAYLAKYHLALSAGTKDFAAKLVLPRGTKG